MKNLLVAGAVALAMSVTAPATADASVSGLNVFGFGLNRAELTEEQKSIVERYKEELSELNSKYVQEAIDSGIITEGQFEKVEGFAEKIREGTFTLPNRAFGEEGISITRNGLFFDMSAFEALTSEQKAKFDELNQERANAEKAYIQKAVETGIITQLQADAMFRKVESAEGVTEENPESAAKATFSFRVGGVGLGLLFDETTLNDEQKAVVDEYRETIKAISLQEMELYKEFNIITEEQAQRLEEIINSGKNSMSFRMGIGPTSDTVLIEDMSIKNIDGTIISNIGGMEGVIGNKVFRRGAISEDLILTPSLENTTSTEESNSI